MANHCTNAKCGICLQEFSAIEELDKHISTHDICHAFRCNFCENVYSNVMELKEHVVSHSVDTPYLCGKCDRRYNSSTYLMLHQSYNINTKSDHEFSDSCEHNNVVTCNQISTCDASSASSHSGNVGSCAWIPKSDSLSPFKTAIVTFQKKTENPFPQSQNILPSYVKLRDIGPLLIDLEKNKEAIVNNTEEKLSCSEEVCEYLSELPEDLNKLTLCMSCCFPFQLFKPHTCQSSPYLMSKKCGFCEVVFNDKSSLQKHVLKIHQVKQNFCCPMCSMVLTKEKDFIQHIIFEHSTSSTRRQSNNQKQPMSKSRRPQKMILSYHVIDKATNPSQEEDYLSNEHDMYYSSDNVTSAKDNCLADESAELINRNNISNPVKNGCDMLKNPLRSLATVNRPIRKREVIDRSTSQHSVCHNCCHIVPNLIQHMKLHSYQERLKCGFCKLTLKTETAARHHYRNSHKERNRISCNSCKWFGVSEKRYIKHCLSVHKEDMNLTLLELPPQKGLSVVNPEPSNTEIEPSKGLSSKSKTMNGFSVCRYCGVVSQNLIDHLTKHQPREFKQCGFCKKRFSHRDKVSCHFRKIHKERQNLFCHICREFRGSEEEYIEHFIKNHPNAQITNNCKSFKGDITKSEFTTNGDSNQVGQGSDDPSSSRITRGNSDTRLTSLGFSEAIQTIINEEVKELLVCKHCCKLYPINELKDHVNGHSLQEKMHCGFCEKEFTHGGEVSRHQRQSHRKNIQCPFCPTEVSSHQNYINHFLNCHYFDMKNATLKSKLRHFVCEFCCEVHESRKLHFKTHTDFTVCGVCGHKFSRKETVRKHFEHKHQQIKDMICPFCPNYRGSVNKYIKHYLENHKEGFILKENEVYAESEEEAAVNSNFGDKNVSESECDTDDDDDANKYHVCEFCSEIHKSLRDHYQKHDDFTVCGFCGIELATKRNIQRHYAMKHKLKKEVTCRICSVVIGSEKKYIEHYLKEHKGGESSDEDDNEADLCRQIDSAFNDSNLEEFIPDLTIVHKPDIQNKLPPLKIPKHRLTNKDTHELDAPKAKISRTVHRSKVEDHLDVTNMFSDEDSDSNSLPDFNFHVSNEDSWDNDSEHPTSPAINVPSLGTESLQDGVPLTGGVTGQVTSNSNSFSGPVFPIVNVDSRTENSQTIPTEEDDVENKGQPLPTPTLEDVSSNKTIGKVICIYCSKVQLDLKEHYKSHSSANLKCCGFCMKRYPNKKYISDHYRVCHKNKNKLSCRFCKHFKSGSEKSYINHFMKNHSNIIVETSVPQSRSSNTNSSTSVKKHNETDADDVCVEERRRITGVSRDVSHLYVCQYCCEVYGKRSLDIHIKKHSKDALQHCGFCSETLGKDTSVLDHYRTEHRDKENVMCRICPFFNGSQEGYIRHYWKYHRSGGNQIREETISSFSLKDRYKCFICEFCGGLYQGLQRHYQSHTDEEMCKCGICGVVLAAKSSVLRHYEAVHKKHNDFSCKQCQINIGSEEKYIKHRVQCHLTTSEKTVEGEERIGIEGKAGTSHKNKPHEEQGDGNGGDTGLDGSDNDDSFNEQTKAQVTFECETCNETFSHQYLLKLHRKCHTEDKLKCDLCDSFCYGEEALRLHKRRAHNIKIDKKCEVCDAVFSTHKAYLTHLKSSHGGYFPHPCPDCPKKFFEKKSLSNHVKKFHTPDAKFRYTCKTCNKGFDYNGSFTNHLRLHSNDRPFVCEVCGKGFRNKITLKVHQNIHSDNRPYKCKFCGKGFRQVSTEQNHRRIHTGEKPYMCHICGKSFHDRGHFHAHKKSSHKNELGLSTASKERKPSNIHKNAVPIFPYGNTNPDHLGKESPHEHNVACNSEMASAVRSIAEPLDTSRVPPPHQQHAVDYQNYFSHVLYPHNSCISQSK